MRKLFLELYCEFPFYLLWWVLMIIIYLTLLLTYLSFEHFRFYIKFYVCRNTCVIASKTTHEQDIEVRFSFASNISLNFFLPDIDHFHDRHNLSVSSIDNPLKSGNLFPLPINYVLSYWGLFMKQRTHAFLCSIHM